MTLAPDAFHWVAQTVRTRSAIQLELGKEYLVENRLLPLARAAGAADVTSYVRAVRAAADGAAQVAIVEALTTNETSFFRDGQPFSALTGHVLPELAGRSGLGCAPTVRIWSAACASGQETYSIAMTVRDSFPEVRARILGTDLSSRMVERARSGRFSQLEVNRGLPVTTLVKHFRRVGTEWEIDEAVRAGVEFRVHNLLDAPPVDGPFDVVFLRNVLIYFDLPTKRAVLDRVRSRMAPGGFLFLGAAETTLGIDDAFQRVPVGRGSVYQVPPAGAAARLHGGAA